MMKNKITLFSATFLIIGVLSLLPTITISAKEYVPQLSEKQLSLKVGAKKTLKIQHLPKSAKVSWKSNNAKIAIISKKGIVVAKTSGSTVVKATIKQNKKSKVLKCKIKVDEQNTTQTTPLPLPLPANQKKNTLSEQFPSSTINTIYYSLNNNQYSVTDPKKITAIVTYLSMLEIEPVATPYLTGGFSIILGTSNPAQNCVHIAFYGNALAVEGQAYNIKNSNIGISYVIQLFLGM